MLQFSISEVINIFSISEVINIWSVKVIFHMFWINIHISMNVTRMIEQMLENYYTNVPCSEHSLMHLRGLFFQPVGSSNWNQPWITINFLLTQIWLLLMTNPHFKCLSKSFKKLALLQGSWHNSYFCFVPNRNLGLLTLEMAILRCVVCSNAPLLGATGRWRLYPGSGEYSSVWQPHVEWPFSDAYGRFVLKRPAGVVVHLQL